MRNSISLVSILEQYGRITPWQRQRVIELHVGMKKLKCRHANIFLILLNLGYCTREDISWAKDKRMRLLKLRVEPYTDAFEMAFKALYEMKNAFISATN